MYKCHSVHGGGVITKNRKRDYFEQFFEVVKVLRATKLTNFYCYCDVRRVSTFSTSVKVESFKSFCQTTCVLKWHINFWLILYIRILYMNSYSLIEFNISSDSVWSIENVRSKYGIPTVFSTKPFKPYHWDQTKPYHWDQTKPYHWDRTNIHNIVRIEQFHSHLSP